MPQGTAPTGDGTFPSKSSAVVCDRCQSGERCSLSAADCADLGHFGDQHRAGNRTDPGDGTQDDGHLGQVIVTRDGPVDPVFQFLDHAVDPLLQFAVHFLEHHSSPKLLVRTDLSEKSFTHFDQLGPFRYQHSEKAQLFRQKVTACLWSECEEAGDEFCINPVCLGTRAPTLSKSLYLSWGHLVG